MENNSLIEEFSFLEGELPWEENSLYQWCLDNPARGKIIMEEWNYSRNITGNGISLTPKDVCRGSDKKVWWKCIRCGNEYKIPIRQRAHCETGCVKCRTNGTSYGEQFIYFGIKQIFDDAKSRCKVSEDKIEFDIVIPSINTYIEYSGEFWHENYSTKDEIKREYCKRNGIRFIEILERNKFKDIEVENNRIIFRYRNARKEPTLMEVVHELFKMIGMENVELDFEEIERKANNVMYYPIDNSVRDLCPEICKEWIEEDNNGAKPECFTTGSNKRIIWTCTKCHRKWDALIASRVEFKTGCPRCGFNIWKNRYKSYTRNNGRTYAIGRRRI